MILTSEVVGPGANFAGSAGMIATAPYVEELRVLAIRCGIGRRGDDGPTLLLRRHSTEVDGMSHRRRFL